jgi:beta-lactamase regulating signal transducer with metallopeptidase domain
MTTHLASLVTPKAAIYLVNLALASVLISSGGLLAAVWFRGQAALLRHAILVSALVLTLLAPGLTWFACQTGWGRIAISLAGPAAQRPSPPADAGPPKDPVAKNRPDSRPRDASLPPFPFAMHSLQKASHEDTRAAALVPAASPAGTAASKEPPAAPATAASWRLLAVSLAAAVWLLGTVIGAGCVARGFLALRRFRRTLEPPSLAQLEQAAREAAEALGTDRLPPIRVSVRAPAPLSLGLLRPLIVLPKDMAQESDAEQLRAILIHEAAHLAHHHHWIGLAQWLAGVLFWWNPLLHRVNRGILRLREEICDDHVLQSHSDGRKFARVLIDLAARLTDLPRVPASLAILETGYSDFQHRIKNLLDKERIIVTRMTRKAVLSVALFGLAIALAVPLAGLRAEEKSGAANSAAKPAPAAEPPKTSAGTEQKPTTDAMVKQPAPKDKGVSAEAKAASAKTTGSATQPPTSAHGGGKVTPEPADDGHNASHMERLQRFTAMWCAKSVQDELHLTDRQKEQLTAIARTPQPASSSPQERTEAAQRSYRRLQAILLPKQLDRAREIAIQFEGGLAFFDTDVIKALELTGDERSKMQAILKHPIHLSKEQEQAVAERINKALERAGDGRSGTHLVLSDHGHLSKEQEQAQQERARQEQVDAAFNADPAAYCEVATALQKAMLDDFLKFLSREQRSKYEKMMGEKIDTARLWKEIMDASLKETPEPIHPHLTGEAVHSAEIAAAMKVLRARPPAEEKDRIAAAIAVIRSGDIFEEKDYPVANALRELIRIGKPAVPRLIEELDRTDSDKLLRGLGFALRGIGDPRAVPALIRAIPRLARPAGSDFGYAIKGDPDLLKFMQENDSRKWSLSAVGEGAEKYPRQETMFDYGRPINEIMPALYKITGEKYGWPELATTQLDTSVEQNRLKRLEFQKLATRWDDWWEKNWQKFVKDEGEAQLEPTRRALAENAEELAKLSPQQLAEIPCGKNVQLRGGNGCPFIISFDDPRPMFRLLAFMDLDTQRMPLAPGELVKSSPPGRPSPAMLAWAEKEGVHLIGMKFKPQGSEKAFFGFQPVGLKVWRIDNSRYDHLANELQTAEKFDLPAPWEGPIASLDEKTGQIDEYRPASFVFLTKRGICGAIRMQSKESYAMPKEGTPALQFVSPFELQFIYRNESGQ